ncbi:Na+/H+ antiporter subunit A [Paenibacillus lemnae]|uniref:Na+/H+ antiporter subunit A n=1 Tax=Paenibacillus lemnae TaxID=1330551 RepID=A0A848MFL7_PAELE|nr:Na+/H+ antiporter subunit A [Paenibacillus lemnae]NMO98214.1 Na+/H+ antiporter subunit A [Paenibacillus lemnae]
MSLLHIAILAPLFYAILTGIIGIKLKGIHTGWLVLPVPTVIFGFFLSMIPIVQQGNGGLHELPWIPSLGINFSVYLDGLSLLFSLLISGIGMLVVLYSIYYLDKKREAVHRFYVYLLIFMGAMLGVVLSDNMMVLYGFWELTSISSFLLIAFWYNRERSRYGALKSMLITVFGGLAMFTGFLMLSAMAGSLSVREVIAQTGEIVGEPLFLPAMILILLGAFTKSAQFPFHIWLPDAMEAPTPVSAYLHSATMVKAGIYLVARFSPVFAGQPEWFWLVSGAGLCTLIYGSVRAMKQTDLKALLAFSTISQLGLIMSLFGLGSASAFFTGSADALFYTKATTAAVFHLINHATFKGALFMVVGIVDHETGTRDLRRLGGLMALMPITFTIAVIGAFSMAGLPPFNGFLSKEMFFTAVLQAAKMDFWNVQTWGVLIPVIAWIASIFTFVYSMILVFKTFLGKGKPEALEKTPHEAPMGLLISPVILASLVVVFGFFPNLLSYSLIEPAMAAVLPNMLSSGEQFDVHITFWHGWNAEIFMTLGVILIGILIFLIFNKYRLLNSPWTERFTLNRLYDKGLAGYEKGSSKVTKSYMTGSIRHYVIYIFAAFVLLLTYAIVDSGGVKIDTSGFAPVSFYEMVIIISMIGSVLVLPFVKNRLIAIIITGMSGYMVTLFFVLFRAPDLALTQMIVETVSVMLFLLCFYHLPKLRKEMVPLRFKWTNAIISIAAGAVVTLLALGASSDRLFASISDYYIKESYNLAGGKNIVNVILVDFRGFDTMLEIMVLGIAAFGIYALIKIDSGDEIIGLGDRRVDLMLPNSNDVILRTISKLVIFIILTFALYLFLSGHNNTGGGFIGGLMTAAALVLLSMAFGMNISEKIIPVNFRTMIAAGLLIALLTGMGSFLFDAPFLSQAFDYFTLPLLGKTELATAVLFDLGVYLAVVGVTMTIIYSIGRDN